MELNIGQFCIRLTVWRYDFKRVLRPLEIALFQLLDSNWFGHYNTLVLFDITIMNFNLALIFSYGA